MTQYIIPVDFKDFRPADFHSQWVGTEEQGVNSCFLIVTRVPPGTGTPSVHTHTGDQFYFILDGDMNLQLADQRHQATRDDLIYIPCAVPHRNYNSTDREEIHVEFIVPGAQPGLARSYRAEWPAYELKDTVNPHYVRHLDRSKFNPKETSSVTLADYASGSHHAQIDIVQVPPGKDGGDVSVKPFDQVYFTMRGGLTVQIGGKRSTVAPHTYVFLPAGVPHTFANETGEVTELFAAEVPQGARPAANVPVNLNP